MAIAAGVEFGFDCGVQLLQGVVSVGVFVLAEIPVYGLQTMDIGDAFCSAKSVDVGYPLCVNLRNMGAVLFELFVKMFVVLGTALAKIK